MGFSLFHSKKKKEENNPRFEDDTLKLTKEDVLKIREELKRYEEQQVMLRNNENMESRQGKKNEKYKERNRFLNIAIVLVILLIALVFYAVFHW